MSTTDYVNWFRHSSPYINAHRGKTFVLMLSGEAIADANFANTVHDIALLNSLGVRLVLVHGARPQAEQRLQARGIETRLHHDLRVTSSAILECVIEAVGTLRTELEARLSMGLANTPMHGARIRICSGNFVTARPVGVLDGIDMGHTGELRRVDHEGIRRLLDLNQIVLLSNLGFSPTGEVFNLSAEEVATRTAVALKADKLILFGSKVGIHDSRGELRSELLAETASRLVQQYMARVDDPEQPYSETACLLEAAATACEEGVPRCHLISYQQDGALLSELFTRDGQGTMVVSHSYEQVRPANIEDVGGILELIAPLEEKGVLVRRSREYLESEIEQFTVVERDGAIIGCAALYPFKDEAIGELACVAIDQSYRGGQRGDRLLDAIEAQARTLGLQRLFVLTTRTAHWFVERGFAAADLDQLPQEKKALYNFQRNSKVFFKPLA
ncbi:MAG: amino-acid N-acetyltransferase [Oceanospirillales bacterium]|uniref:Amino-acid acetyltransferase n=1 Tax=Marinobacterium halophilum TaxID=267374 RepID=A0A2P8EWP7_9GAMM|nr:amino-acid N-acetyltransferase [Oceanospirillales bacterium]PSL13906.1 N-acetylglutamate synthase [Marinobacterium halophilum]